MSIFSYHLVKTSYISAFKAVLCRPKARKTPGLIHAEYMTVMTLGSSIFSPSRLFARRIAVFAQWQDEAAIDNFLTQSNLGRLLSKGWHVRLTFLRQWGKITGFDIPEKKPESAVSDTPVVAVTLARMKPREIPRFIQWGRPVEKLVRDHPGKSFAVASIRLPKTVSTFSIWKSKKEMTDMVHGRSPVHMPKRHSDAMKERERKDFHFEFTTLRFAPISEFGVWEGQSGFLPKKALT